jgi:hypothetical protein
MHFNLTEALSKKTEIHLEHQSVSIAATSNGSVYPNWFLKYTNEL